MVKLCKVWDTPNTGLPGDFLTLKTDYTQFPAICQYAGVTLGVTPMASLK